MSPQSSQRVMVALLAMALPSCTQARASKFESPEACYEALVAAQKNADPTAILPCFSEAFQNHLLGSMAFQLERLASLSDGGAASRACQAVLQSHGLHGKSLMGFLQVADGPVGGGAPMAFMQIGDSIKDKRAFFSEGSAALKEAQALFAGKGPDDPKAMDGEAKESKLVDVTITGDTARGKLFVGQDNAEPIFFKREGGSWVVMIGEQEPDWRQPIRGQVLFSEYLKALSQTEETKP